MTDLVFPAAAAPTLPVEGTSALFPVRRILCVGRNYAAHRREMGGDDREPPFFFAKPADAVVSGGGDVAYPSVTTNLHHEIELVAALQGGGVDIAPADAISLVFGYAAGVDLTRRDLQNAAKDKGQPWEASKGFDQSAPIGVIRPAHVVGQPEGRIALSVNGQVRQDARLSDMIWNLAEVIAQASRLWRLAPGDLIFTGTPEGVGPLVRGDHVDGEIEGVGSVGFRVV
jgi:fumarylpyruvate hydrolase